MCIRDSLTATFYEVDDSVEDSDIIGGENLSISWGQSTDPDGNLAGYKLERKVNGCLLYTSIVERQDVGRLP